MHRSLDGRPTSIDRRERTLAELHATGTVLTEHKRAEEALRQSEERVHDYAESVSDRLWENGPDYKFTLLTENAFGSDLSDRIGKAWWDHVLDPETEQWRLVLGSA